MLDQHAMRLGGWLPKVFLSAFLALGVGSASTEAVAAQPTHAIGQPRRAPASRPAVRARALRPARAIAADATRPVTSERLKAYQHTVIHTAEPRGGNGDIAAGYLTAKDMRGRLGYTGQVTLVTSDQGLRVLSRMTGKTVHAGSDIEHPNGPIRVETHESLPAKMKPADLYVALARPDGHILHDWVHRENEGPRHPLQIALTDKAVVVSQPVFGNTEKLLANSTALPHGSLQVNGKSMWMNHAGVGSNEAGVYRDPVAASLRGLGPLSTRKFVVDATDRMPAGTSRTFLSRLLNREVLAGSDRALAYGIGAAETAGQFGEYLQGVADLAKQDNRAITIVTPSGVSTERIPEHLRDRIEYVSVVQQAGSLPARAKAGKVYLVQTETLPHDVFVGLMADSKIAPIVAGDGALAAAVGLQKPFVMTELPWSRNNVRAIGKRLVEASSGETRSTLGAMFSPVRDKGNLSKVAELQKPEYREAFARATQNIGSLTDHIMQAVQDASDFQSGPRTKQEAKTTSDPALRTSLLAHAAAAGDSRAARDIAGFAHKDPVAFAALILDGTLTKRAVLSTPALRSTVLGLARGTEKNPRLNPAMAGYVRDVVRSRWGIGLRELGAKPDQVAHAATADAVRHAAEAKAAEAAKAAQSAANGS